MLTDLFLIIFFVLAIIYLLVGLYASHKVTTTNDYFLAGRSLGVPSVMFTLIATQLGGGMLLGTAQEGYMIGLYGIVYTLGMGIGFLLLAFGLAARLQSLNITTTAELFETKYGSPTLKKVASLLSMITLGGILIAQIVGSKAFLLSIGFSNKAAFLCFWSFTICYTMLGGLQAVVLTDIVQVTLIIIVFVSLFLYSIATNPISFFDVLHTSMSRQSGSFDSSSLITTICMPALFSLIEQDLAQRFFASRSPLVARLAALGAGTFLLLFACIPIYFGILARITALPIADHANPLMPMIATIANGPLFIIAACAIIAAINSTADSLLCAISSNLAHDFSFMNHIASPLRRSQIITLLIGITAIIASDWVPGTIISILINSYELSVYTLLIPLLGAYFLPTVHYSAAAASIITSSTLFLACIIWQPPIPKAIIIFTLSGLVYAFFLRKKIKQHRMLQA